MMMQWEQRMQSWGSGDWMCGACQHLNFKKREQCQRCEYPKYGGPDPSTHVFKGEALAGDWYCHCGAHNYASRAQCFVCAAPHASAVSSDPSLPPAGWKTGDWCCPRSVKLIIFDFYLKNTIISHSLYYLLSVSFYIIISLK